MTARTSFLLTAQDAEARVLAALVPAPPGEQKDESGQRPDSQWARRTRPASSAGRPRRPHRSAAVRPHRAPAAGGPARARRPRRPRPGAAQATPAIRPGQASCPPAASEPANSSAPRTSATRPVALLTSSRFAPERSAPYDTTVSASTAPRKTGSSRNSQSVPSKSIPASALASAPARSGGRKGRTPVAPARPAPCPMSRTRLMAMGAVGRLERDDCRRRQALASAALDVARSRALRRRSSPRARGS